MQFKYTTILCLANKELNKDILERFEYILKTKDETDEDESSSGVLHCKLFGSRESVREVLSAERKLKLYLNVFATFQSKRKFCFPTQILFIFTSEKSSKIQYRIDWQHIDTVDEP